MNDTDLRFMQGAAGWSDGDLIAFVMEWIATNPNESNGLVAFMLDVARADGAIIEDIA